jgi:uncharacterized protein (TIGR03083 family)
MTVLGYDRCCAELLTQTDLLRALVADADPSVAVPGCPRWNLAQLLRHVGGAHRWAEAVVRTRSAEPVPHDLVDEVAGYAHETPEVLDAWLAEGARHLVEALRGAGPDVPVWSPGPGGTALFWARRMLHETVVHRADASWAVGAPFAVARDVALDAVDEWMGFGSAPELVEPAPGVVPLLGPGRTLHVRATGTGTDAAVEAAAEWLVDLSGDAVAWRRAHAEAAVTVRAAPADLVLLLYGRYTADDRRVEVRGDRALLDLWLERTSFWLRE